MKHIIFSLYILLAFCSNAQITGVWKGLLIKQGQKNEQAQILWIDFSSTKGFTAVSREEIVGKEAFNVRKLKGKLNEKSFVFTQLASLKKKDITGIKWCDLEFTGSLIDSTGYIQGTYISKVCSGVSGKFYLFKTDEFFPMEKQNVELQSWRPLFVDDIKNNRKSKELRELDRKNFQFQPVYFDFDKSEIKSEYVQFLQNMTKIVLGHTDLRIRVVGHTDAKGSDEYNVALSQKRAQVLIDAFVALGLSKDRIVIDFKGEKEPVSDNSSAEGRQMNRRVDFSFI